MRCEKRMIGRILAVICTFVMLITSIFIIFSNVSYAAEIDTDTEHEDMGDERPYLTNSVNDTSYAHDCTVSVFISLQPDHERFGGFGYNIVFIDDDHNSYISNINIYEVQNALKDGTNQIQTYFYLPKGHWTFEVYAAQGITTDDVKTVCLQNELTAEEGGVYQIHALSGTSEWVSANQNLIPAAYRIIGENLIDKKEILAMDIQDTDDGLIDPATLTKEQIENLSDDTKVLFSNTELDEYFNGRTFYLSGKYYKQWYQWHWEMNEAEDSRKTEFNVYIKDHASDTTKGLDVLFEQYCIETSAETDEKIVDSTAVSAAEDANVEISEHNPLKNLNGLFSVIIVVIVCAVSIIYNRRKTLYGDDEENE